MHVRLRDWRVDELELVCRQRSLWTSLLVSRAPWDTKAELLATLERIRSLTPEQQMLLHPLALDSDDSSWDELFDLTRALSVSA